MLASFPRHWNDHNAGTGSHLRQKDRPDSFYHHCLVLLDGVVLALSLKVVGHIRFVVPPGHRIAVVDVDFTDNFPIFGKLHDPLARPPHKWAMSLFFFVVALTCSLIWRGRQWPVEMRVSVV